MQAVWPPMGPALRTPHTLITFTTDKSLRQDSNLHWIVHKAIAVPVGYEGFT